MNTTIRFNEFYKLGVQPNNIPQPTKGVLDGMRRGQFFGDMSGQITKDIVALKFLRNMGSIYTFQLYDIKSKKKLKKTVDLFRGQLSLLRTLYGFSLKESLEKISVENILSLLEKYSGKKIFIKEFTGGDENNLSKDILGIQELFKKDYPTFIENLSTLIGDKKILKFLQSGLKDGKSMDDKFGLSRTAISCKDLTPTQSEVDISKSLNFPLQDPKTAEMCLRGENVILGGTPLVSFNKRYVIDGHHRWSQTFCLNPNAQMLCLNLTKANTTPLDALKSTQVAVATATGNIPVETVEGHNLFKAPKEVVVKFVLEHITDDVMQVFNSIKGFKNKEQVAEYIWHNCQLLQKNNLPIAGAPDRGLMPQTGNDLPGVIKNLVTGKANSMEPFAKSGATMQEAKNLIKEEDNKIFSTYAGIEFVLTKEKPNKWSLYLPKYTEYDFGLLNTKNKLDAINWAKSEIISLKRSKGFRTRYLESSKSNLKLKVLIRLIEKYTGKKVTLIKSLDKIKNSKIAKTLKKKITKESMFIGQNGDLVEKQDKEIGRVIKDIFGYYDDIVGENDWGHEFIKQEEIEDGVKIILNTEALEELYQIEEMIKDVTENANVKCIKKKQGVYIIKEL